MRTLTFQEFCDLLDEAGFPDDVWTSFDAWFARGDGAAIYVNHDLGSPEVGQIRIASYGSEVAQIESPEPPDRLPDIGGQINWRWVLEAVYRPEAPVPVPVTPL